MTRQDELDNLVRQIQALIREGETERAFGVLFDNEALLDKSQNTTATILRGRFQQIKQSQIKNLLSHEEVFRAHAGINDALLQLALQINTEKNITAFTAKRINKWRIAAAIGILALLGWWAAGLLKTRPADCPDYSDQAGLRVLVFPFNKIQGEQEAQPALAVIDQINAKLGKAEIPNTVHFYQGAKGVIDPATALSAGENCGAHLVISGDYATLAHSDSFLIKLRYQFVQGERRSVSPEFTALANAGDAGALRTLDDAVFSMCALIAASEGKKDIALQWLSKIKTRDPQDERLPAMLNR